MFNCSKMLIRKRIMIARYQNFSKVFIMNRFTYQWKTFLFQLLLIHFTIEYRSWIWELISHWILLRLSRYNKEKMNAIKRYKTRCRRYEALWASNLILCHQNVLTKEPTQNLIKQVYVWIFINWIGFRVYYQVRDN